MKFVLFILKDIVEDIKDDDEPTEEFGDDVQIEVTETEAPKEEVNF